MKIKHLLISTAIIMTMMASSCDGSKGSAAGGEKCDVDTTKIVMENILTRTSIRQFTDQKIDKDIIDNLLKAGMAAPSAVNAQPWAFVVVDDKAILDSLNEVKPWFNLKTATAAIIVCGDMSKAMEGPGREYWVQDCSAVTENILLAAHAYGLGAVWCGVYPNQEIIPGVVKVLNLPENIIPLNVITMGYPAENPEPKDKFKSENIHYNVW
ncbi:MAG: nitroreductase family protein [Muribaculaceae bacterium]|nr:nitroreductase family protein [Muribaculaceae bacterium]